MSRDPMKVGEFQIEQKQCCRTFIVTACLLVAFQNCQKNGSSDSASGNVLTSNLNGNGEGYTGTDSAYLEICSGTEKPGALSPTQTDQVNILTAPEALLLEVSFSGEGVATFNYKVNVTQTNTAAGSSFTGAGNSAFPATGGGQASSVELDVGANGNSVFSYTLTFPNGTVVTKHVPLSCASG